MVIDIALSLRTISFLVERDLVSETEFDELCDLEMTLHRHLRIEIIPYTAFSSEPDIMESLFTTGSVWCLIYKRTLRGP